MRATQKREEKWREKNTTLLAHKCDGNLFKSTHTRDGTRHKVKLLELKRHRTKHKPHKKNTSQTRQNPPRRLDLVGWAAEHNYSRNGNIFTPTVWPPPPPRPRAVLHLHRFSMIDFTPRALPRVWPSQAPPHTFPRSHKGKADRNRKARNQFLPLAHTGATFRRLDDLDQFITKMTVR